MLNLSFDPFPYFEWPSFHLRPMVLEDGEQLLGLRSNPSVMKYIGRPLMQDLIEAQLLIQRIQSDLQERKGIAWAMADPSNNHLVGTVSFWKIDEVNHRAEIGYMMLPEWQGRGIMRQALSNVLTYGFQTMHLHGVDANVDPENVSSIRLLEKLSFTKEAHFKENYYFEGVYLDSAIYCLLKKNFTPIQPNGS